MLRLFTPILLLLPALCLAEPKTLQPNFLARVIHVDDGDTVVVMDALRKKTKVRLANIDAPETGHGRCRPGQPWSAQSTEFLARAIKGQQVELQCSTLDLYGRSICDIRFQGTTANRMLVAAGLAWANRANPSYLQDPAVADAERAAAAAKRGLWSDPYAIPPWKWRRTQWDKAVAGCS